MVVHDDHGPNVSRDPRSVEAEEIKEADSSGEMDFLVEPPAPVEDGLGGEELPDAEADDHDATQDKHGNDPASLPAIGLELGEVKGEKEHEETTADEEESKGVDVNQEGPDGSEEGHGPVRVGRNETLGLGSPLVDGQGKNDGDSGNGRTDREETGAPTPVGCLELLGNLASDVEVDDVGKTDKANRDTSPFGGDVVGKNDLLHNLNTSVADGVENSTASNVTSGLGYSNDDKADHPEEDRESVSLSATEDIGELSDGEFADSDEYCLNDTDGGVSRVVVELRGSSGLPGIHGVVVKTSKVSNEGNAQDADPKGPVSYTSTSFSSKDTDLLLAGEVLLLDSLGIPVLVALDVLDVGSLRHVCCG